MHRQSTWRLRALAANQEPKGTKKSGTVPPIPLWLRLSFLAYADHESNGHANYARGKLAEELKAGDRQLRRALTDAIRYGYLDSKSSLRCLRVPPGSVYKNLGTIKPCGYCGEI
ncbi:hypothetical protein BOH72_14065 [Mycobacterium sp. WY10]|nr:hypothetical protein BOH72_14065 [Mycobacterium sp. WY10]